MEGGRREVGVVYLERNNGVVGTVGKRREGHRGIGHPPIEQIVIVISCLVCKIIVGTIRVRISCFYIGKTA